MDAGLRRRQDREQAVTQTAKASRSCSVVDSIDCECPPSGLVGDLPPVTCYACGNDVCRNCSTLITYAGAECASTAKTPGGSVGPPQYLSRGSSVHDAP